MYWAEALRFRLEKLDKNKAGIIALLEIIFRWDELVMRMEERDPAKKVLCTKPARKEARRRGRPKLRRCNELEEVVARAGCKTWRINP